jgi:multiple sugar transport system ATP-binding protein
MSVGPEEVIGEGEDVGVVFDRDKIHLFDTDSEQAVVHGLK